MFGCQTKFDDFRSLNTSRLDRPFYIFLYVTNGGTVCRICMDEFSCAPDKEIVRLTKLDFGQKMSVM